MVTMVTPVSLKRRMVTVVTPGCYRHYGYYGNPCIFTAKHRVTMVTHVSL